jgi:hypothetical protein
LKTLITGAGSSIAIDSDCFYDGIMLINNIKTLLSNDLFVSQLAKYFSSQDVLNSDFIINQFRSDLNTYVNLKDVKLSIDNFLSEIMIYPEYTEPVRSQMVLVGKYAIFYEVMKMEENFKNRFMAQSNIRNWVLDYKQELDRHNNNIIITFNYDRLIEYLLGSEYKNRILHVYGTIDIENWEFGKVPNGIGLNRGNNEIDFRHLGDFLIANDRVRYEKTSGIIGIEHIAQRLQMYNFIMGFGFDFYNVRNLGLFNNSNRKIYANLYPTDGKETAFCKRRQLTYEVRKMIPDAYFTYFDCSEMIKFIESIDYN